MIEHSWAIEATAERFQVDAKTVRKWRDRVLVEGTLGYPTAGSVLAIASVEERRFGDARRKSQGC